MKEDVQLPSMVILTDSAPEHAIDLHSALREAGCRKVSQCRLEEIAFAEFTDPPPLLISLSLFGQTEEQPGSPYQTKLDDLCTEHGVHWLRAVLHPQHADIGPVFGSHTPCFRCFCLLHPLPPVAAPPADRTSAHDSGTWLAWIALRVVHRSSGHGPMSVDQALRRYDLSSWQSVELYSASLPGCPRCHPRSSSPAIHAAMLFEQYLTCRATDLPNASAQREYEALCRTLSRQSKSLRNFKQIRFDHQPIALTGNTLELLRKSPVASNLPLSLPQLGELLRMTAGIRSRTPGGTVRRWAASAGNLGSVELFVFTRGIHGLAQGLYFYQPAQHTLAHLERRSGPADVDATMHLLLPESPQAEVAILFTSAFARLQRKYGPFSYKLSNLDAGVALAQFHLVARGLGLWSKTANLWPDDLIADLCALDGHKEHVTAVVALSRLNPLEQACEPAAPLPRTPPPALSKFSGLTVPQILDVVYREGRRGTAVLAGLTSSSRMPEHAGEPGLTPPLHQPARSPAFVISRRATVRHFTAKPILPQHVSNMLYNAVWGDAADWPALQSREQVLQFLVAARSVDGLAPAVYAFEAVHHQLIPLGPLPTAEQEENLFRGRNFTSASIFVWICANLQFASNLEGSFAHRRLLLRAGAAANRLWLSAIALGLEGGLVAGVHPGPHAESFQINGVTRVGLIGFATQAASTHV